MVGDAQLASIRARYASEVMGWARRSGFDDPRVERAFAAVSRERFLTPPPWRIFSPGGVIREETSDPAALYDDVLVVLDHAAGINNGQPSLHASWMAAVEPKPGETVVQVGVGAGYYTAILAWLVGEGGRVHGYEIDRQLAGIAAAHLADFPWVDVLPVSGLAELPPADILYVSAGAAAPPTEWLRALKPGGRLIFPWQPGPDHGTTLLVRRRESGFAARAIMPVSFIGCIGADARTMRARGMPTRSFGETRSVWFRADRDPDETATAIHEHVWLSAREI
ncbi:protein-L-isoaspartate O-methyltransferase [uncultured Enterovirga sp.]|uniref:protein-L-isoaspartate O-methyltransferase family protein n=1 Tax=uncultured Enterovirga sp. TaxID=2026352 RepID=UPI0035CC5915